MDVAENAISSGLCKYPGLGVAGSIEPEVKGTGSGERKDVVKDGILVRKGHA
jgi:hypothetical protein